jgi:hypothetical protein
MMKRLGTLSVALLIATAQAAYAEDSQDLDRARDALTKQDNDADTEKALEQVFEAAEKNYSLLEKGGMSLNYNFDYTYYGDQRIDLEIADGTIRNADVSPVASHSFTNSFAFDYGLANNITLGFRLPLVAKFETQDELSGYGIGDISSTVRFQPSEYVPGKASRTYFGSLRIPTGVSPYEINENESLPTGGGTFGLSGGISTSKVLDPVVLFGSLSGSYSLPATGLKQARGDQELQEVNNGAGVSFSMGFAYSLSYDISLSASFQGSYSHESEFVLYRPSTGQETRQKTSSQMSGIMNFALGVRVSPKTIANVNVGFGMTELSPDIILGLSLPIDIEGAKPSEGS